MVIDCVVVLTQFWSEMLNVTVLVPDELYNTPLGFSADETAGIAPCPKFQLYDQLLPVLPVLVKLMPMVEHCGALDVNEAVGV